MVFVKNVKMNWRQKMKNKIRLGAISGAGSGVGFLLTKWIISTNPTILFVGAVIGAFIFAFVGGSE